MSLWRGLARLAGLGSALLLLAPALALGPAAVLDRGPDGTLRPTLFPIALAALDPFVWDCARRSLTVAALVTACSFVVGLLLAVALGRGRFGGRATSALLGCGGLALVPFLEALGWRILVADAWPWLGLCLSHLARGVALVALAALPALAGEMASERDAARLSGARRLQAWLDLTWPLVRPRVARALSAVFLLALADPGPPLVLGLRRSLAFQLVEAALRLDPTPRAAVLALLSLGLGALGTILLHWWGGAPIALPPRAAPGSGAGSRRLAAGLIATACAILLWMPIGAVVIEGIPAFARLWNDPVARRLLWNSGIVGLVVVVLDLLLVRALIPIGAGRSRRALRTFLTWPDAVPPLVLAVGGLALVALLDGGSLRGLADMLDRGRAPGVLLVVVLLTLRLPLLAGAFGAGDESSDSPWIDAARLSGATPRQARRLIEQRIPISAGLAVFASAATDLAPALLLAPTIESRTLGAGILLLADQPGDGLGAASALATVAVLVHLAERAVAASAKPRPGADNW